jgi:hypothetical protein
MLRMLRDAVPRVHIKAFTAVEIVHLDANQQSGRAMVTKASRACCAI